MQTFKIEQTDSQCVVTWRNFNVGAVYILFFFLSCWTGLCLLSVTAVFVEDILLIFFALPCCGLWIVIFAKFVSELFGKRKLVLDETGVKSTYNCLFIKDEKWIDLDDICRFKVLGKVKWLSQIRVVCRENDIDYSVTSSTKELGNACRLLNVFLKKLRGTPTTEVSAKWDAVFDLHSSHQFIDPPPKSRWSYKMDFNGFGFRFHGLGRIMAIITLFRLFSMTVVYNGVVWIGMLQMLGVLDPPLKGELPKGGSWWIILFFGMIPFVFFGFGLVILTMNMFIDLFRTTTWTFSYNTATFRTARLGLGRTEIVELTGWKSLVVRVPDEGESETEIDDDLRQTYEDGEFWQLAFLNAAGESLMSIDDLRKSEALWMADVVLRERRTIQ